MPAPIRLAAITMVLLLLPRAAAAQVEVAPPPHPALDEVMKEYLRLELPLPRKDAVLVRIDKAVDHDLSALSEEERRTWLESRYLLAFRTTDPARPHTPTFLVTGRRSLGLEPYRKPVFAGDTEVRPNPGMLERGETHLYELGQLAVFYKLRGENELAKTLYSAAMGGSDGPLNLPEHFRECTWYALRDRLCQQDSDRREILKGLKRVADGFENEEEGANVGAWLISSLEATVGYKRRLKVGAAESLIDDLMEYGVPSPGESGTACQEAYWKLVDMGFDAVPALIEHVRDDRLSRGYYNRIVNNFHGYNLTVGHLCCDILYELSARTIGGDYWPLRGDRYDPDEVRKWFAEAKKIGEEKWLLDHAIPKDGGGAMTNHYGRPEPRIVRIIGIKYSKHLVAIHRKTLKEFGGHFEAIATSKLPRDEKTALLKEGLADLTSWRWNTTMYQLAVIDRNEHRKALLAMLREVETAEREGRRKFENAHWSLDHLESAGDPECWKAFASMARQLSFANRLWTLHVVGEPEWDMRERGSRCRAERLGFLLGFLDDCTAERSEDPHLSGVEVRYYAACLLAGELGFRVIRAHDERIVPNTKNGPLTRLLFRARMAHAATQELERLRKP